MLSYGLISCIELMVEIEGASSQVGVATPEVATLDVAIAEENVDPSRSNIKTFSFTLKINYDSRILYLTNNLHYRTQNIGSPSRCRR